MIPKMLSYLCEMTKQGDEFFKDIRPYRDHEIQEVFERLLKHPAVERLVSKFFPTIPLNAFAEKLRKIDTVYDFQENILHQIVNHVLDSTSSGFTYSGVENVDRYKNHLFISNHRDITLDPTLITTALVNNGFNTPEVAIGNNLIQEPWISDVLRLTKSFIVKRNLPAKELILFSKKLSQYIYYVLTETNQSVWIAQREGRAKDGNDITQPGLFSMLGMSSKNGLIQHFQVLNIIPVSISYEFDPCDMEKVRSLYAQRFLGGYKKRPKEDEDSMKHGIVGFKGHINIHFGHCLNEYLMEFPTDEHKNETITRIRHLIDDQIIMGYKLWPTNYIAHDLYMHNTPQFECYDKEQREYFIDNIEEKLTHLEGDMDELRRIFYEMYARPVINKHKIQTEGSLHLEPNK